jgi:hypothetical protein
VVLCLGLFEALVGCEPRELPGEPIGVYHVVGTLEENSCGPRGLPADNPLLFDVEIRDDDGIGVWALPQKPFILGTIKSNGEFLFRLEDRYTLRPAEPEPKADPEFYLDPEAYREPQECHLSQVEVIQGIVAPDGNGRTLDAGVDASVVFIGTDTIDIQPMSNTDCRDMLATASGTFATLPCRAVYTLEGELSDED